MEESHVRKRVGRFIKKSDPIREEMSISDFNLMDICDSEITFADNLDANIIHNRLHLKEDLLHGVRPSQEIESIFEPAEYRPVIKPLNFTQEWKKQQARSQSRSSRLDEEDEIDIELEDLTGEGGISSKGSQQAQSGEEKGSDEVQKVGLNMNFEEHIDGTDFKLDLASGNGDSSSSNKIELDESDSDPIIPENMKEVEEAIKTIAQTTNSDENSLSTQLPSPSQESSNENEAFTPMTPPPMDNAPHSESSRKEVFEEARSQGYEDGYKIGEEKAMVVIQEKVNQILSEFSKMIHEFEGMKSNILHSAQDNFRVVCQTLVESLLQKEFSINPKAFEQVLERAIKEAVPDDEFKIIVSQESYERIKDDISESLRSRMKVDTDLSDNDFKIESKLSVVDGKISQIISDLLDSADIHLFDDKKSSDDKAG